MQAGDLDAGVGGSPAQTLAFRGAHQMGIFTKSKGCQLQTLVAGLLCKTTLRRELQIANDFVA